MAHIHPLFFFPSERVGKLEPNRKRCICKRHSAGGRAVQCGCERAESKLARALSMRGMLEAADDVVWAGGASEAGVCKKFKAFQLQLNKFNSTVSPAVVD